MKTTLEEAKENSHEDIVNHLQQLLEKNYDAEAGYKKAMTDADSSQLKNFLKQQAVLRNRFATELDKEIRDLNETCLLYTSPSPRDRTRSRMPSSA